MEIFDGILGVISVFPIIISCVCIYTGIQILKGYRHKRILGSDSANGGKAAKTFLLIWDAISIALIIVWEILEISDGISPIVPVIIGSLGIVVITLGAAEIFLEMILFNMEEDKSNA